MLIPTAFAFDLLGCYSSFRRKPESSNDGPAMLRACFWILSFRRNDGGEVDESKAKAAGIISC